MAGNEAYGVPPAAAEADYARGPANGGALRNRIIVAVVALTVLGSTAGWVVARLANPGPSRTVASAPSDPPPSPNGASSVPSESASVVESPSPQRPATTPPAASTGSNLLQLVDLGPGHRAISYELIHGRWFWSNLCPGVGSDADYPSLARRQSIEAASWEDGQKNRTSEIVERFAAGGGATNVADLRTVFKRCTRTTAWPNGELPASYPIEATGFAGDESILVCRLYGTADPRGIKPTCEYIVAIRVGDRVATILLPGNASANQSQELAKKAAARLR